ncbi:MAG: Co2+/Mg2+ efflux protein ApaG [Gammaproteobacteria bacterium]
MQEEPHYEITIEVKPEYVAEQSQPDKDRYVFAYTIDIKNTGNIAAKLLRRHWIITDANNKVQEVNGDGVIGKQPYLQPGKSFRYTSAAILETPIGCMQGHYEMLADDGVTFKAPIEVFRLAAPMTLH